MKYILLALVLLVGIPLSAQAGTAATYNNSNGSQSSGVVISCSLDGVNSVPISSCTLAVNQSGLWTISIGHPSTDGSTTQTTGGTAQVLFGGITPPNGFKIAIPASSTSSTPCWLSDTTTTPSATTAGSYPVFQQGQYSTEVGEKPAGPVYINCPITGQPISPKYW